MTVDSKISLKSSLINEKHIAVNMIVKCAQFGKREQVMAHTSKELFFGLSQPFPDGYAFIPRSVYGDRLHQHSNGPLRLQMVSAVIDRCKKSLTMMGKHTKHIAECCGCKHLNSHAQPAA